MTLAQKIRFGPALRSNHVFRVAGTRLLDPMWGLSRGPIKFAAAMCGVRAHITRVGAATHLGLDLWLGDVGGPPCGKCRHAVVMTLGRSATALGATVSVTQNLRRKGQARRLRGGPS